MRAHFPPVGQAHATLLEFPCGAAPIDAGAQDAERLLLYPGQFFAGGRTFNGRSISCR